MRDARLAFAQTHWSACPDESLAPENAVQASRKSAPRADCPSGSAAGEQQPQKALNTCALSSAGGLGQTPLDAALGLRKEAMADAQQLEPLQLDLASSIAVKIGL